MISTEPEYSYDPVKDIHSFNPMCAERPTRGRSRDRSTIVVQNSRGITTIPVYSAEKPHDHIVELHSVETRTEDCATHGLKELFERQSRTRASSRQTSSLMSTTIARR